MTQNSISFWMSVVGTACWGVCFLWMWRISVEQNQLMERLGEQSRRIEKLSKIEHDLIKEVHPQVGEIKEDMAQMIAAVKVNSEEMIAAVKESTERISSAVRQEETSASNPGSS